MGALKIWQGTSKSGMAKYVPSSYSQSVRGIELGPYAPIFGIEQDDVRPKD